jgi:hypothetical protein
VAVAAGSSRRKGAAKCASQDGDRKALQKELVKARAMTKLLAEQSEQKRRVGEALNREADKLACQSWNEKMWSDGGPIHYRLRRE